MAALRRSFLSLSSLINQKTLTRQQQYFCSKTRSNFNSPVSLKSRLKNGEILYGLGIMSFSPTLVEIVGLSGYDFILIDMEHGFGGVSETLSCLQAFGATGSCTQAIIRVPHPDSMWTKKVLDIGAQGIMFPSIENKEMAKKVVSYCKYPPKGVRGSCHTLVRDSDYGIDDDYLNKYEDKLLIVCQVESVEGVKNIEEIAGVDGVDCVQMVNTDLSTTMGYLSDPSNRKVTEMMRRAEKGVLKMKKEKGDHGRPYLSSVSRQFDMPEEQIARGYDMIIGYMDVGLFRTACLKDVKNFKMKVDDHNNYILSPSIITQVD